MNLRSAGAAARGILSLRPWMNRLPKGPLSDVGYEVIENWMDDQECERLIQFADGIAGTRSYFVSHDAYFIRRKEAHDIDTNVSQIMNAHLIDESLREMAEDRIFERLFETRLGLRMSLDTISIQIDDPDTDTKRGYHVDRISPPSFKAFVYLTDVDVREHGPYTVIPGSHKHVARKFTNAAASILGQRPHTDQSFFYHDERARAITGRRGTCILSTQQLVHKGWTNHAERRRYMVVAYLQPEAFKTIDKPFRLGADIIAGE